MNEQNKIILYQDDNETTRVSVRFSDENLWLTQNQDVFRYCTEQTALCRTQKYSNRSYFSNHATKYAIIFVFLCAKED